jgi:hypothetical protein
MVRWSLEVSRPAVKATGIPTPSIAHSTHPAPPPRRGRLCRSPDIAWLLNTGPGAYYVADVVADGELPHSVPPTPPPEVAVVGVASYSS